jgi:hypothetical protein
MIAYFNNLANSPLYIIPNMVIMWEALIRIYDPYDFFSTT